MSHSRDDRTPIEEEAIPQRPYPKLPAPTDLPRFAEEGERDPFGQNEEMLNAACQSGFEILVELASLAHARGLCMMLPSPEPGYIDPALKPWRSVVSCEPDDQEIPSLDLRPPAVLWGLAHGTAIQNLVQRTALCVAALGESPPPGAYDRIVEILEELGYIALGRQFYKNKLESASPTGYPLQHFYNIGQIAAKVHDANILHGDMHAGNFLYGYTHDNEEPHTFVHDYSRTCSLERTLTPEERASDLGLLKLSCSFEEWEAAKLGYLDQAPDQAAQVFKLI